MPAFGQAKKLNVGWIGTGSRGAHVMNQMYKSVPELVTVTAVCDTFEGNKNKGKDIVQTTGKNTPKTFVDYKDVLADKSIDVVFITTPEHLHHEMAITRTKGRQKHLPRKTAGPHDRRGLGHR